MQYQCYLRSHGEGRVRARLSIETVYSANSAVIG